jgi:hypothetical protein
LLNQNNRLTKGQSAIRGPAMLGLSRSAGGGGSPYGGGGGPGEIPDSIALNSLLADKSFGFQQMALEDAVQARQERASALMKPTPEQDLFTGRTAARERAAGDILRDEQLRNATATGTAEANTYLAPGQAAKRQQEVWAKEYANRYQQPFDKAVIEAQARTRAAEAAAMARQYVADQQRAGNVEGKTVTAFGQLAGRPAMTPEEQQRITSGYNELGGRIGAAPLQAPPQALPPSTLPAPLSWVSNWWTGAGQPQPQQQGGAAPQGQGPQRPQPGYPGGPVPGSAGIFPAGRLEEYAQKNGMTVQQARQFIEQVHGYLVQ